jgi:hypothetical protein
MQNLQIFKSVQLYIKRTKHFTHLWSQHPLPLFFKLISSCCSHFTYKYGKKKYAYII